MKSIISTLVYGAIFLAPTCGVRAQNNEQISEHIDTVINAKPVERVPPKYPISAARNGQEGWARVSFVIDKQGNVVDPIIQDTSGLEVFNKEALKAVKKWKYSPAIQDGEAIEQCQMSVQLDFRLHKQKGVTRKFMTRYKEITQAIADKKLRQADTMLKELGDSQLWNHSEIAFYYLADAVYAKEIDDQSRELHSINRALFGTKDTLSNDWYLYLLERQFVLNLAQQEYLDALDSFNTLQTMKDNEAVLTKLTPYAEQVRHLLKGKEPLLLSASIRSEGQFYHRLSRDKFSLQVNQGELDEVQIRCANKRSRFTVVNGSEWQIPSSWGQCTIFVTGSPKTQFNVLETGAYVGEI